MRGNGVCHLCVAFSRSGANSRSRFCTAKPPKANAVRVSAWLKLLNLAGKYRLPTNPLAPAPGKHHGGGGFSRASLRACENNDWHLPHTGDLQIQFVDQIRGLQRVAHALRRSL